MASGYPESLGTWGILDGFSGANLRVNHKSQIGLGDCVSDCFLADNVVDPRLWTEYAEQIQQMEIAALPFHAFPSEIRRLSRLRQLTITGTNVEYLPPDIFCGSHIGLQFLSLSGNCLKQLPPSIILCDKLSTINLSSNDMSTDSLQCLPELTSLVVLKVSDNPRLACLPDGVSSIVELEARSCGLVSVPQRWVGLKSIILADNSLTTVDELSACEKLKLVDLSQNPLVDKNLKKAAEKSEGGSKEILKHLRGGSSKRKVKKDKVTKTVEEDANAPLPKRMMSCSNEEALRIHISKAARAKRPHMYAAVLHFPKDLTLDEDGLRAFLDMQNTLHSKECQKRALAGIASHDFDAVEQWPLLMDVACIGGSSSTSSERMFHALALHDRGPLPVSEVIQVLQRDENVGKYTREISSSKQFAFLTDGNGDMISLYPVSNCAKTKNKPGMRRVLIEVSSCLDSTVARHVFLEIIRSAIDIAEVGGTQSDGSNEIVTIQQVCVNGVWTPSRQDISSL